MDSPFRLGTVPLWAAGRPYSDASRIVNWLQYCIDMLPPARRNKLDLEGDIVQLFSDVCDVYSDVTAADKIAKLQAKLDRHLTLPPPRIILARDKLDAIMHEAAQVPWIVRDEFGVTTLWGWPAEDWLKILRWVEARNADMDAGLADSFQRGLVNFSAEKVAAAELRAREQGYDDAKKALAGEEY